MLNNYHQLKENFIKFFKEKNHLYLPPSGLIPKNSKAVLFTNSGMMQFVPYFKNEETPPHQQLITIQPCVRIGGKHNDIENIGKTPRHATFFEMMGNFSFGGYGKKEAIEYAYEFLTKILKLQESNLFFTVYHEDEEAYDIWRSLTKQPILKISSNDNFWSMGELGPAGPCTEIYYYTGINNGNEEDFLQSFSKEISHYLEIWNIVFMQYDRTPNGMVPLKRICIDTGMGLERILSVIEGTFNIYETSLLKNFVNTIKDKFKINDTYARVIADHIRTSVFIINEGVVPHNEGHGYVLRKIIRRAFTYMNNMTPNLYIFVEFVINIYKNDYTFNDIEVIQNVIKEEELLFINTIQKGFKKLEHYNISNINEMEVFKLHETYGLPIEFSLHYLENQGIHLQEKEIQKYTDAHRNISNKTMNVDLNFPTEMKCYTHLNLNSEIICLLQDNNVVKQVESGEFFMITHASPFYPRGGGQDGDKGTIITSNGTCQVLDTTKQNKTILHHCKLHNGIIKLQDKCEMIVNENFRKLTTIHHTLTHILHSQLQKLFGKQLDQKGSRISDTKLRFDFNHTPLTEEDKQQLVKEINVIINAEIPVEIFYMTFEEAISKGADFLQNIEYDPIVRVIKIGDISLALCGGTHIKNTKEIKEFLLLKESSVQSGIRRIEAKANI